MSHRFRPRLSDPNVAALTLFITAIAAALGGCSTDRTAAASPPPPSIPAQNERISVIRSGRYALIEVNPQDAQRDLMRQVIDVTIPRGMPASVADMMRYVLLQSGFTICAGAVLDSFETLPLPAAHQHLGPITLRDALDVIAGVAWQLEVDEARRQVCFTAKAEHTDVIGAPSTASAEHTHEQ